MRRTTYNMLLLYYTIMCYFFSIYKFDMGGGEEEKKENPSVLQLECHYLGNGIYGAENVQKYALNDTLLFYSHNTKAITSRRLFAENKLVYNMRLRLLKKKKKNDSSRRRNEYKISCVAAVSRTMSIRKQTRNLY